MVSPISAVLQIPRSCFRQCHCGQKRQENVIYVLGGGGYALHQRALRALCNFPRGLSGYTVSTGSLRTGGTGRTEGISALWASGVHPDQELWRLQPENPDIRNMSVSGIDWRQVSDKCPPQSNQPNPAHQAFAG